ncbi:MAG: sigma-54-dependent Fis family transcriptional regulator [Burkholderiales bacterium]|nr:sigma-54-dependent Fis family transcriptional regulator [Burkholderiales bacterium]
MDATASQKDVSVLVVDDEPDLRTLYELALVREGYQVVAAGDLAQAWERLAAQRFDVVITDMRLPDGLGTSLLQRLREQQRRERCVVITAYGSADNAVESLKAGAFDYLTKPVDIAQFRAVIASAVLGARKEAVAGRRHNAGQAPRNGFNRRRTDTEPAVGEAALQRLVGESRAMRLVKERVAKVARSMAPVLVSGESGTGKELVARALHANSHRSAGPLVAVNCSAIPEQLLEAEFFGSRKGAFTGAAHDRDGFFQAAGGGTLFLDEIGDLPLAMQSKLLRAIQERSVRRVGSTQEEAVDVRIDSATQRDLAADVQAGRFRQDLFYRLNVIDIQIPPLRERLDDLPALCESLLARIAQESGVPVPALSAGVLEQICLAPLKGNVRELENLLHRAVALSEGGVLQVDVVGEATMPAPLAPEGPTARAAVAAPPAPLAAGASGAAAAPAPGPGTVAVPLIIPHDLQSHLDQQEREILVQTLRETGFNRTAAAARLGLSLRQIRYRIARLKIDAPTDPEAAHDGA